MEDEMCTQNLKKKPSFEETSDICRPKWETLHKICILLLNKQRMSS